MPDKLISGLMKKSEYDELKHMPADDLIRKLREDVFCMNVLENGYGITGDHGFAEKIKLGLTKFYYSKKYNLDQLINNYELQIKTEIDEIEKRRQRGENPTINSWFFSDAKSELCRIDYRRKEKKMHSRKNSSRKFNFRKLEYGLLCFAALTATNAGIQETFRDCKKYSVANEKYQADTNVINSKRWDIIEYRLRTAYSDLVCVDGSVVGSSRPLQAIENLKTASGLVKDFDNEDEIVIAINNLLGKIPAVSVLNDKNRFDAELKIIKELESSAATKEDYYDSKIPTALKDAITGTGKEIAIDLMGTFISLVLGAGAYSRFLESRRKRDD